MVNKKGLSIEEKRERMQEFFHETKDVFTMKQLETSCSKKKGIVSQTVKEIAASLVSDDLIKSDKIGIGVFYWSFPSESLKIRENKTQTLDEQLTGLKRKIEDLEERIESASVNKEESDERSAKLRKLAQLEEENASLKAECAKFAEMDPEVLDAQRLDTQVAIQAANRWTDNVFECRSYLVKTFNQSTADMNAHFGIPEDFDYLE